MAKALPVTGIVACVFAALSIAVFVPDSLAMFLPLLVGVAGSVVLVGQRSIPGAIVGLVVLALSVVAALGLIGTVSTEDGGDTDFGVSLATGQVLAIAACLAIPLAAIGVRWSEANPRWLAIAGGLALIVAFAIVVADPGGIAQQNEADTLVAAVAALLGSAAMVALLRGDSAQELPPLAVADAPVRPASAPAKGPAVSAKAPPAKAPAKPAPPGRRP